MGNTATSKNEATDEDGNPRPLIIPRDGYLHRLGGTEPLDLPVSTVIITHTKSEECNLPKECLRIYKDLQRKDCNAGLRDIKHNFLVGGDGYVYEGRGWERIPEKDPLYEKYHGKAIHIAYIGDFTGKEPDSRKVETVFKLIEFGYNNNFLSRVIDFFPFGKEEPMSIPLQDEPDDPRIYYINEENQP